MTYGMEVTVCLYILALIAVAVWLAVRNAREERQWDAERRAYEERLAEKRARLDRYEGRTQ